MPEAWIVDAVRTPRGKGKKETGGLSGIHPQELLAQCLNALKDRSGFDPKDVEDVVAGCVSAVGDQGACIARMSVLAAGWPEDGATGVTLNRFCGSGQQAVNFAAMGVMSGQQDLVVGGGVESMSRVPMGMDKAGMAGHNPQLNQIHPMVPQGISADLIATLEGFGREELDAYAVESQRRCAVAQQEGRFDKSLVPVRDAAGRQVLARDEHPRPGGTLESLGQLPPSFEGLGSYVNKGDTLSMDEKALARYEQAQGIQHVHHAGNSSGIVDGAAAVLIASPDYARANGLTPRARLIQTATAAAEPIIMLTAPTPATQRCLDKAGMQAADLDLIEINEAFATVPLKTMRDLKMSHEKVNVNGGAIALGHPLGATGAMLIGTLLDELERQDKTTGLVTMCIGGGMGTATILERIWSDEMIDFEPTEEQALIVETVRQFAENEIRPKARECDEAAALPRDVLDAAHELGLVANGLPEEHGGGGEPSAVLGALIAEELAWGDVSIALGILSPSLLGVPVARFGTDEQKKRVLGRLTVETFVAGSLAITEPRFDSDPFRPQTRAKRDGGEYILDGTKCQVPWLDTGEEVLVVAAEDDGAQAFLVPCDAAGIEIEIEKNLGTHALPLAELTLSSVRVPAEARLGGEAGCDVREIINRGRLGLSAAAIGMARAAFEVSRDYAKERETFGQPIATRQAIAFKIADMAIEIDGARMLLWEAACAIDAGEDATRYAALAYEQARRTALRVSDDAVQVFGGHGFIRDYLPEMYLRNAGGFISGFEALTLI